MSTQTMDRNRLFGAYRLGRVLAEGATGMVVSAEHRTIGRTVALKTFHPLAFTRSGLSVAALTDVFLAEARILASVDSPNIITLFDAGLARSPALSMEIPYLALALADSDLERCLTIGAIDDHDLLRLLRGAARGLVDLHAQGWIHRDLKPANLLILNDGTPAWADLSSAWRDGEDQTRIAGTEGYAAPEARFGGPARPGLDVFAFGATAYHALVGEPVERLGDAVHEACLAARGGGAHTKLRSGLAAIITHCLGPTPDVRYAGAKPLLDDLDALAAGESPVHAPRPSSGAFLVGLWRKATG